MADNLIEGAAAASVSFASTESHLLNPMLVVKNELLDS